ncbi:MAG: GNAT family N-acetyltransferase [Pseudolysinimonas sp.]
MTIDVRPTSAADEESWRRLFRDYGVFYETHFEDAVLDKVWKLLMTPGAGVAALTAEHGGEVVGFAHYRSHPDTFSAGRDWFLDDLYVDPSARGKGAATALIEHLTALAKATGPGTLRWITAESNERAQRVYDRIAKRTTWVTYEVRL